MQAYTHARLHALPYYLDTSSPDLSPSLTSLGASHEKRLLTITGTLVRAQGLQLFEAYKVLECLECKALVRVNVSVVDPKVTDKPEECHAQGCGGTNFRVAPDREPTYTNYQEVNIQACWPCFLSWIHCCVPVTSSVCTRVFVSVQGTLFAIPGKV